MPTGKVKHVSKGVRIRPEGCATPGSRVAFLRLSFHPTAKARQWTQQELAEIAGVSAETITRIENDLVSLTPRTLEALTAAFRVPAALFTCSMKKWCDVIRDAGLEATVLASGRRDIAKKARRKVDVRGKTA